LYEGKDAKKVFKKLTEKLDWFVDKRNEKQDARC
jgi:hypothetical protein